MTKKLLGTLLGVSMMVSVMASTSAFAEDSTGAKAMGNAAMFPFRLTTGALGGAFGAVSGGIQGIGDMEKHVFQHEGRSSETGYVQSNFLTWPVDILQGVVVAPFGLMTGMPKGFAQGFRSGWDVWPGSEAKSEQ